MQSLVVQLLDEHSQRTQRLQNVQQLQQLQLPLHLQLRCCACFDL